MGPRRVAAWLDSYRAGLKGALQSAFRDAPGLTIDAARQAREYMESLTGPAASG